MTFSEKKSNIDNDRSRKIHPNTWYITSSQIEVEERTDLYNISKNSASTYVTSQHTDNQLGKSSFNISGITQIDRLYSNIAEAAKNCSKIYFIYLSFLSYAFLTVVTISDINFVFNESVELPIIKTNIPGNLFFLLTPVLSIAFFSYIHIYLIKIDELIKFTAKECRKLNNVACREKKVRKNKR